MSYYEITARKAFFPAKSQFGYSSQQPAYYRYRRRVAIKWNGVEIAGPTNDPWVSK